ncbi:hypothetical protein [Abyssisolibacter fermentans]|uniref:hypothetical protein n=1 Tax=Abyssisolibacter fermentans TaxID=1766203 RepID=UPI0008366F37|nr:hypothetical protein [Abyssisolibacter fermentans]
MKKVFFYMLIVLICTTGCFEGAKATNNCKSDIIQNCLNKYYEFLSGEISLSSDGNENSKIDIYDIFFLDENYNKYTLFDSNHNGVPELHLSSMREYIILECVNDELDIIYSGSGYETLLSNGALLYIRSGGGPEHISYAYTKLDANNNIIQITFTKYNTKNDEEDDDLYLFEDVEVSRSEFDEKTKNYLNINSDMIIWSDYWTFLVEKNNCNCDEETN